MTDWTDRDARRVLAMIFLAPETDGTDAPNEVDAVCDWTDAVSEADAAGRLGELLRMRDLLGATPAVQWWGEVTSPHRGEQ